MTAAGARNTSYQPPAKLRAKLRMSTAPRVSHQIYSAPSPQNKCGQALARTADAQSGQRCRAARCPGCLLLRAATAAACVVMQHQQWMRAEGAGASGPAYMRYAGSADAPRTPRTNTSRHVGAVRSARAKAAPTEQVSAFFPSPSAESADTADTANATRYEGACSARVRRC